MDPGRPIASAAFAEIPGLVHGFGLRVSGTRTAAREETQRSYRDAGAVFFLRQVHGNRVVTPPWADPPDADASWTETPGSLLAIETADCLPVLIVDQVARRVAAAHAGWRGTAARVAERAVATLVEAGSKPDNLRVTLGPSIGPCCYEVGPEVVEAFGPDQAKFFASGDSDRSFVDVAAANRAQLEGTGISSRAIDHVNLCTSCRPDLFFSYRRDGANAGRMISVIGFSRASL